MGSGTPIPAVVDKCPEPVGKDVERKFERKYQGEEEVKDIQNSPGLIEGAVVVGEVVVELHLHHIRPEVLDCRNDLSHVKLANYHRNRNLLCFTVTMAIRNAKKYWKESDLVRSLTLSLILSNFPFASLLFLAILDRATRVSKIVRRSASDLV